MSKPRISIVTPSFNHAQFLEHALCSVLDQDYENLEYIVIDGGSTDGSVEMLSRYAPRLAYWVSEPDGGHGSALNKGFKRSTGEIMAWLNSDDLHFPWTLNAVAEIFAAHPEVSWITSHSCAILDQKGRLVTADRNYSNKYDYLLGRCNIQQESTFWRRSLWENAGGYINEDYKLMVDGELWTRFFLNARLYNVQCLLGGFRRWGGNRSISNMTQVNDDMRRCVAAMERSCDADTLSDLAKLRRVLKMPKGISRHIARKIMYRLSPTLRARTAYHLLTPTTQNGWLYRTTASQV